MRVIKIEIPARLTASDPNISFSSDEIRAQLFKELRSLDQELSEIVRQRAKAYFPETYSVFVRTLLVPERPGTVTEMWVVDPNIRWPAGLLTRRAWKLFIPILSHIARESMVSRLTGVSFDMEEKDARVSVLAPTRSYLDPFLIAIIVFLLTTAYWVIVHPWFTMSLGSLVGPS